MSWVKSLTRLVQTNAGCVIGMLVSGSTLYFAMSRNLQVLAVVAFLALLLVLVPERVIMLANRLRPAKVGPIELPAVTQVARKPSGDKDRAEWVQQEFKRMAKEVNEDLNFLSADPLLRQLYLDVLAIGLRLEAVEKAISPAD